VLATLSIYDGLNVWNNFILPLVLTQSNNVAVLPSASLGSVLMG
jgi:raffinose/stachyose/melibiose transport system permease protein